MLSGELLDGGERLAARLDREVEFAQDLRDCARGLFVGTEQ